MSVPEPLLASVYDELRRLAAYQLGSERRGHTLQATALVHEAYLRLAGQSGGQWHDRLHFIRVASETMRRVLVDHARSRLRNKRGGGVAHVSLSEAMELVDGREVEVLDLDRALNRLAQADPRKARLVECVTSAD
jgi:RNA polymerase sigma factor (TIGR02999 family)